MRYLGINVLIIVSAGLALSWAPSAQQRPSGTASAVANGPMSMSTDVPAANATVILPFTVAGWTIDTSASSGTGMDAVHVWAVPRGGTPVFLGAATMGVPRSDIAAMTTRGSIERV